MRVSSSSRGSANSVISSIRPSSVSVRDFEGDLSAIVGFTPVGVSYYDDREYEAIIRKGEPERSYYTETLNTATRGSRKEFPLRGLVAWSATQVAIVDMEGGQPQMWKSLTPGPDIDTGRPWPSDAEAFDARISHGYLAIALQSSAAAGRSGLAFADFVADKSGRFSSVSTHSGVQYGVDLVSANMDDSGPLLANARPNAVAISDPLDHYPLDEYGRPAFAVAAATDGGVSVILPDADNRAKRVTDGFETDAHSTVSWQDDYLLASRTPFNGFTTRTHIAQIEAGDGWGVAGATEGRNVLFGVPVGEDINKTQATGSNTYAVAFATAGVGFSQDTGFGWETGLKALLSSTALSGWMPGDCKLALDFNAYAAGSVAASTPLDDDFTSYADQAAAEAAGYTFGTNTSLDAANDQIDYSAAADATNVRKVLSVTSGDTYVVEVVISNYSAGGLRVYVGSTEVITTKTANGTYTGTVTVSSATPNLDLKANSTTTLSVDSITIKRAIPDLSPANNGAIVNGTLTAAAVETGADLFGLSGWSTSNYLQVAYTTDLEPGSGDFYVAGWITWGGSSRYAVEHARSDFANARWNLFINPSSQPVFELRDGTNTATATGSAVTTSQRQFVIGVLRRSADLAEIWVDGKLAGSASAATLGAVTNASASTFFGIRASIGGSGPSDMALVRIGQYAPTPEQIRKMYRDERKLFEAGATCFLPSNTVNSLDARDGLLLIGTEGGAVIHDGFKRLELLDSGDIGLTESGVDSVALLGGDDVALITGSDVVARRAARDLAHPQVIDAYKYERAFSGKSYTTDATPTDIAKFPLAEGERVELRISVDAGSDDGTEYGTYTRVVRARRDISGNVTVTGTDTLGTDDETTAGMDVAFAADTTAQTVDLQVTGVASTNMQWSYEATLTINKVV